MTSDGIDYSALSDADPHAMLSAHAELHAGVITDAEAAELLRFNIPHPFPIRHEPSFACPPYLRVLLGGTLKRLRWFGWPGHVPKGWSPYLMVAADGTLQRMGKQP